MRSQQACFYPVAGARISRPVKGVVSLRKRLQLTQAELAVLADVSTQSVVKWEKHDGKIPFRKQETAARMQVIRGMTKNEAWGELG